MEDGVARLGRRIAQARRPLDRGRLERQLGRLLERNQRAAGRDVIDFVPDPTVLAGVRLTWAAPPEGGDWARGGGSCYVLRTKVAGLAPQGPWRTSNPPH